MGIKIIPMVLLPTVNGIKVGVADCAVANKVNQSLDLMAAMAYSFLACVSFASQAGASNYPPASFIL